MKPILRWTSLALFALLGAFFIWFGWVYATVEDFLWFHAPAVPEAARNAVRPIYFALMNLIGGLSAGLGILGLWVTAALLRRGDPKTALGLAVAYAVPLLMAAVTAEELARTGAPTSWHIMGGLLAVAAFALFAHVGSCAKASAAPASSSN